MADPIIIEDPTVTTGDTQQKKEPFTGSFPIEYTRPEITPISKSTGFIDKYTDEWMSSSTVQTAIALHNKMRGLSSRGMDVSPWDGASVISQDPNQNVSTFDRYNPENFRGYERIADKLVNALSESELQGIKRQYDEQNDRKARIAEDPSFVAALSAAATDPTALLIPFWTVRGAGVVSNIFRGAASGGVASAVDSGLGYTFDPTFTIDDAKERIFYGTLFGGILGGGIGFATRNVEMANRFAGGNKELDKMFDDVRTQAGPDGYIRTRASVYKAEPTTPDFNPGVAEAPLNLHESVRMTPFGRVMQSGIRAIADLAYMAVGDGNVKLARNVLGFASPDSISTRIENRKSIISAIFQETDNLYNEYRTGSVGLTVAGQNVRTTASRLSDVFTTPAKRAAREVLSPTEFDREVFLAIKKDRIEATSRSAEANPFIQRAAENLHEKLKAARVELNENGLFLDKPTRILELKRIAKRKQDLEQKLTDIINTGDTGNNSVLQIKRIENEIARMHDQITQYEMYGVQHIDDLQGEIDNIAATYRANKDKAVSSIEKLKERVKKFDDKYRAVYDDLTDLIQNGEILSSKQQAFYDSLSDQMSRSLNKNEYMAQLAKKFNRPLSDKEMDLFTTINAAIDHTNRLLKLAETGAYDLPPQYEGGFFMHRIFNKEAIALDEAGPRNYRKILTDAFTEQTRELGFLHEKKSIAGELLGEKYSHIQDILTNLNEKFSLSKGDLDLVVKAHEDMFGKSIATLLKEANVSVKYGPTGKTRNDIIRLYRGGPANAPNPNIADWIKETESFKNTAAASGRWFTDNLESAKWYIENEYPDGIITYIDLPKSEAEKFRLTNIAAKEGGQNVKDNPRAFSRAPEEEFYLPSDTAKKHQPFTDQTPELKGSPVHAIYHGKTNTISIDLEAIAKTWADKPWENPKVKGVDPIDGSVFKTPADWVEFVFRHEIAHSTLKRGVGEKLAEYENRINRVAMAQLEQRVPKRQLTEAERSRATVAKEIRRSINQQIESIDVAPKVEGVEAAPKVTSLEDDLLTPEEREGRRNAVKAKQLIKDIKNGLVERLDNADLESRITSKINQRVDDMIGNQLGLNDLDVHDQSGFGPSSWRLGRKINLTNDELKDFIVTDVREVSRRYFEQTSKAIEYKKAFGTVDAEEAIADAFIQAASEVKGSSLKKMEDTLYKHEVDLRLAMDSANHSLKNDMPLTWTNQTVRLLKNYAASTMMGKVIKSQVVDVMRPIMVFGFGRTYDFVIDGLVGGLGNIKKASAELQSVLSEGHDTVMGTVTRRYMDSNGNYKNGSVGVEKYKNATEGFNKFAEGPMYTLNGLSIITDYTKSLVNLMSANFMIADSIAVVSKKATTQQLERLLSYGLTAEDITNIAALHKNGVIEKTSGNLYLANIAQWPDKNLLSKFTSAISQETNRAIVTPSAADKSALAQGVFQATSPLGRKIFGDERLDISLVQWPLQFMTWAMGANNRILLSSLQGRDANAVGGALALIGAGYFSGYLKTPDKTWEKMKFEDKLVNAIDTSGLLGSIADINNMVETASHNTLGFRPMMGMDPRRRGMDDSMTDILGPAPNMLLEVPKLMTDPYMTDHQKGNIYRRMIPLNNVIWWDGLLKGAQKSMGY